MATRKHTIIDIPEHRGGFKNSLPDYEQKAFGLVTPQTIKRWLK
jgi:hypothetical protein